MKSHSSWKQKIEPAFDKIIGEYIDFLHEMRLPGNEGYIVLEPKDRTFTDSELEGFRIMAPLYEKDNIENAVTVLNLMLGNTLSKGNLKKVGREIKNPRSLLNMILALGEACNKESRDYYLDSFHVFTSKENFEAMLRLSDKEKTKLGQKLFSDILGLMWHHVFITGVDFMKQSQNRFDILMKGFHHKRLFRTIFFFVTDTISLIANKKSIRELYREAKNGDDESLFKLIKVDKTLFDHEWLRVRIRKAMYSGEGKFFRDLAKAIKADPLDTRHSNLEASVVLLYFWNAGLYRLTVPELMDLLKSSGIHIEQDEVSFRKVKDRIRPFLPMPVSIVKNRTQKS